MSALFAKILKDAIQTPVAMLRLFPDAIFWGVGFLAFVTLSYSYSAFFVALVEALLIFHVLYYGNQNLQVVDTTPLQGSGEKCRTGFADVSMQAVTLFNDYLAPAFPSPHIYMASFITSYIMSALIYFKDELEILSNSYGEVFKTRLYVSTIAFVSILFVSMSYRLFSKCDSALNIVVSLLVGLVAGVVVAVQNHSILGKESLNLLGVPILRKMTDTGNDLFVCSPTT